MKIENSFTIDAPVEQAWAMLTNIPEIAPCLPGAKLTGEEDGVYSGNVKVKVGPVTAEYRGTAEFVERDDVAHRAVIDGKGRDSRGAGNASALITAEMHDRGDQTQVDIVTDLKITGKVAQFGRGVMQDVSEKLLGQFADCLAEKIVAGDEDPDGDQAAAGGADAASDAPNSVGEAVDGAAGRVADKMIDGAGDLAGGAKAAAAGAVGAVGAGAGALAGRVGGGDAAASDDDDDGALDLLDVAGGAVFRRLIPVAILVAVIVIILLVILL